MVALLVLQGMAGLVGGDANRREARPMVVVRRQDELSVDRIVVVRQLAAGLLDVDVGNAPLGHDGGCRLPPGDPAARENPRICAIRARYADLGVDRDGLETLRAVASGVGGAGGLAAVLRRQTVAPGGIGLAHVPLRQAVVAEQQMVVAALEILLRAGHQRRDVVGLIEARRLHLHPHWRRERRGHFLHPLHRGLEAGHRIMREQGNQQDFVHALLRQVAHRLRDGRMLITHRQLDRNG